MAKSRAELDRMLDGLRERLPILIAEYPDNAEFWMAFAGEAELIEDGASAEDYEHVRGTLDSMLAANDLLPRDE